MCVCAANWYPYWRFIPILTLAYFIVTPLNCCHEDIRKNSSILALDLCKTSVLYPLGDWLSLLRYLPSFTVPPVKGGHDRFQLHLSHSLFCNYSVIARYVPQENISRMFCVGYPQQLRQMCVPHDKKKTGNIHKLCNTS